MDHPVSHLINRITVSTLLQCNDGKTIPQIDCSSWQLSVRKFCTLFIYFIYNEIRQITKIRWQDHIRNSEVAARTGLGLVSDLITRCRNSVFGHIARLSEDTPAHQVLRCPVDLTLGHLPDQSWKCRPGRPNNRWIDQLRRDNNNTSPADLWRRSTTRGHSGVTLRSSTTTRWRRRLKPVCT